MTAADPNPSRPTAPDVPDLLARFTERAEPLGVRVGRVPDVPAAAAYIATTMRELGAPWTLVAAEVMETVPRLRGELAMARAPWAVPAGPEATRDHAFGVSLASLAVAETASVLLAEPTLEDRAVGMLTAAQLVICPTAGLVPSLDEAAPVLREIALRPGGGYATLVTGPSRTADIERVLTVGVQGPARVDVLFVDDLA